VPNDRRAWHPWPPRLAWFGAGAIAHALLSTDADMKAVTAAVYEAEAEVQVAGGAAPDPDAISAAVVGPVAEAIAVAAPEPEPDSESDSNSESESAPAFPLPRMPGTQKIRTTATRADDGRGWLLVHAVRVPARPEHAEAFYRKALADQGLRVTGGSTTAEPNRIFLRARGRQTHAAVTITSRPGKARTTVNVIWRVFE